jgi:hypothetical protein
VLGPGLNGAVFSTLCENRFVVPYIQALLKADFKAREVTLGIVQLASPYFPWSFVVDVLTADGHIQIVFTARQHLLPGGYHQLERRRKARDPKGRELNVEGMHYRYGHRRVSSRQSCVRTPLPHHPVCDSASSGLTLPTMLPILTMRLFCARRLLLPHRLFLRPRRFRIVLTRSRQGQSKVLRSLPSLGLVQSCYSGDCLSDRLPDGCCFCAFPFSALVAATSSSDSVADDEVEMRT